MDNSGFELSRVFGFFCMCICVRKQIETKVCIVRLKQGFRVFFWCACVGFSLLAPETSVNASTIMMLDPAARRGGPIAQTFLENQGENVSLVRTQHGISCVASRVLPIADASYSAPDGTPVSFEDVTRSPASSIQAIARLDEPVTFRVQLKYSPDPSRPIEMRIDGQMLDLVDALEPSSDSLLLTGNTARLLADKLRRGSGPTLSATSDATGRQITDRIMAPDMTGLDSCLVTLKDLPAVEGQPTADVSNYDVVDAEIPNSSTGWSMERRDANDRVADTLTGNLLESIGAMVEDETDASQPVVPVPVTGLRLEFTARPDPELRVDPGVLKHCRMRDIPDDVFLGRLTAVTGFFSQTQDVYVAFDDQGELQRAYIPGIFDSYLTTGTNPARISLAADSNLPDQPNTVRGCLGDAPLEAPVCAISKSGSGDYTVAECGVLGMSQTREEYLSEIPVLYFTGFDEPASSRPLKKSAVAALIPKWAVFSGALVDLRKNARGPHQRYRREMLFDILFQQPAGPMTTIDWTANSEPFSRAFGSSRNLRGFGGFVGGGGVSRPISLGDNDRGIIITGGGSADPGERGGEISVVPLPAAFWMMLLALTALCGTGAMLHRKKSV